MIDWIREILLRAEDAVAATLWWLFTHPEFLVAWMIFAVVVGLLVGEMSRRADEEAAKEKDEEVPPC